MTKEDSRYEENDAYFCNPKNMCDVLACIMALSSSQAVALNLETEKVNGLDTGMAILENINAETKRGATHISRWNERESNLNTLVFENEGATVTSYFFADLLNMLMRWKRDK